MEQSNLWSYQKSFLFDFWDDFKQNQSDKRASEPKQIRNESESEQRIREAFQISWWDIKWWLSFIVLPLSEKIGYENVLKMKLPDVFLLRGANADRNEFEEYSYWYSDLKREKEKKEDHQQKGQMKLLMPTEKNQKIVQHAMESADNYFMFLNSRGFNGGKTILKGK